MKIQKIFLLIILAVCVIGAADAGPKNKSYNKVKEEQAGSVKATVGYIFDGDTFAATVSLSADIKISVRVRIINIDAPEMSGQCDREIKMAIAAKKRLAELIPMGSTVELSKIKDDKYLGRIDARVKNKSGIDVGDKMVTEGHARKYGGKKRAPWCDIGETRTDSAPTKKTITMNDLDLF